MPVSGAILGCIWRKPISTGSPLQSDNNVEDWLESDLFSRGLSREMSHKDLLVPAGQQSCFDRLVLPRVAVHSSQHLDRVEREVIIACLYHAGILDDMLAADNVSEKYVLLCQVRLQSTLYSFIGTGLITSFAESIVPGAPSPNAGLGGQKSGEARRRGWREDA